MATESGFGISMDVVDEVDVIDVWGDADLAHADAVRQKLESLTDGEHRGILVDLTRLTFMDSTIAGALFWAQGRARRANAAFAVVCPNPQIRRIFELTALDRIVPLYQDRTEALASLPAASSGASGSDTP